ncbi:MAG: hypothetical protein E7663_05510 [Ruminococcaceae bacterium]|nr:hypothetical protein [Oscillospiraceae bacterium]
MKELLRDCLYPVLLGSNTLCHACVRQFEKHYGVCSTVLTGKRALTLRFLPAVRLINAPPSLSDDILFSILCDLDDESGMRVPMLVLCDDAYHGFFERRRKELEPHFILRRAEMLLEGRARE